jgi:hypothetical protein
MFVYGGVHIFWDRIVDMYREARSYVFHSRRDQLCLVQPKKWRTNKTEGIATGARLDMENETILADHVTNLKCAQESAENKKLCSTVVESFALHNSESKAFGRGKDEVELPRKSCRHSKMV